MIEGIIDIIPQNGDVTDMTDCEERDGKMYCKKCGTLRQIEINVFGTSRKVWCLCQCQAQEEADIKLKLQTDMSIMQIRHLRELALADPDFKNCTFDKDNGKQPRMKECRKYARDFKMHLEKQSGLLLLGPCGTGKTFASKCIANRLIDSGYPVLVTNFGRIAESVTAAGFEERGEYYDSLMKYPLLVIDDMGRERESDFMMEIIQRVIDDRDRSGKPMIVSTNFTAQDINNPRNDNWARIFSRIMKTCYPLKFDGDDNRAEMGMKRNAEMKKYFESD